MANYDTFLFVGHGKSEKDGSSDSGAVFGKLKEYDIATQIVKSAKKYLDATGLKVHYDEQNLKGK